MLSISDLLRVFQFHAATMMPVSYLVAGTSSTPRKPKLRDRRDASWNAIDNSIRSMIAAEL